LRSLRIAVFVDRFSNVVAEETCVQDWRRCRTLSSTGSREPTPARPRADTNPQAFRDVFEVNGRGMIGRPPSKLFLQSSGGQEQIA
jgi:hypothetical protein